MVPRGHEFRITSFQSRSLHLGLMLHIIYIYIYTNIYMCVLLLRLSSFLNYHCIIPLPGCVMDEFFIIYNVENLHRLGKERFILYRTSVACIYRLQCIESSVAVFTKGLDGGLHGKPLQSYCSHSVSRDRILCSLFFAIL